jgi:hypothetical protein
VTLVELMVVTGVISLLIALSLDVVQRTREQAQTTTCKSRLRQVNQALTAYALDQGDRYPAAAPPVGFGDLANWGDLWRETDVPGGYYFGDFEMDGVKIGNRSIMPRLPRLLEPYAGDVTLLHCPSRGRSQYWPEVGPFYYNATSPWGSTETPDGVFVDDYGRWEPRARPHGGPNVAVAACMNPLNGRLMGFSWRHGVRVVQHELGRNNHLYVDGSVEMEINPKDWRRP